MNVKTIWFSCCMLLMSVSLFAQDENEIRDYIEKYKSLAIAEQIRSGIPAAITLAQGIHESTAGTSELATKGNNHFGIKCKSTWMGETMLHDDDKKQECFRKYVNAEQSYIDHSDFLKESNRYHFLFDLDRTDYVGWASGLKRAGYATNPLYVKKLTDLVEKFNLQQYTYEAISKSSKTPGEIIPNDDKRNEDIPRNLTHIDDPSTFYKGLKGFWAGKGETLLPKALEKNIRYAKLLALNDLPDQPLQTDMFIFIDKKRKVGTEEFHIVKAGENMILIAQKEAMLLSSLYAFNNLTPGQEPETGERLTLQYKSYDTPKTKQQFLKEFETAKSSETIITKVEKKSITESVPALAFEEKEKAVQEQQKAKIVAEEKKQLEKEQVVPIAKVESINNEPKQSPSIEKTKVQEQVMIEKQEVTSKVQPAEVQTPVNTNQPVVEKVIETAAEPEKQTVTQSGKANQTTGKNELNDIKYKKDIIDAAKAKRMEELLNSEPIDKPSAPAVMPEQEQVKKKTSNNESPFSVRTTDNETTKEVIKVQEPVAEKIAHVVPVVKRTYDELNVNDSVKDLKKKFDQIVYSPRPPRKIDTTKRIQPVIQKPIVITKEDEKKSGVQVTATGIKRDLKKAAANKEAEAKKAESKKKAKEDAKKAGNKKSSAAGKKGKDKKESGSAEKKKSGKKDNNTKKPVSAGKKPTKKK